MIQIFLVPRSHSAPTPVANTVFLGIDHWNDFSFITMFEVTFFDESAVAHYLGNVKVGFKGQSTETSTYSTLENGFNTLPPGYFSVGMDVDYYLKLSRDFSKELRAEYLEAMRDVAHSQKNLEVALAERVFRVSLLRSLNVNSVTDQFRRVLGGGIPLTNFAFRFTQDASEKLAPYQLDFSVEANSTPSTNVHAIIGRNGAGKTTLLNNMTRSVTDPHYTGSRFEVRGPWSHKPTESGYFSGVVSVSFSAFDPFNPPVEQSDPSKGACYFYVGLKSYAGEDGALLKSQTELADEFVDSLRVSLSETARSDRWREAIQKLESDDNFAEMDLARLSDLKGDNLEKFARSLLKRMSSGHAIVLLTITKLVARVDEKTLVLFDEPESHLHPPLLSALIRSLSALLTNRNAVAIIATHSPVVLQEIPKSCVWKITRSGLSSETHRPEIETFGENVGLLTREVFSLEVTKSGFNDLLLLEASRAASYEEAVAAFNDQLGLEGRAILRAIMHRTQG